MSGSNSFSKALILSCDALTAALIKYSALSPEVEAGDDEVALVVVFPGKVVILDVEIPVEADVNKEIVEFSEDEAGDDEVALVVVFPEKVDILDVETPVEADVNKEIVECSEDEAAAVDLHSDAVFLLRD